MLSAVQGTDEEMLSGIGTGNAEAGALKTALPAP